VAGLHHESALCADHGFNRIALADSGAQFGGVLKAQRIEARAVELPACQQLFFVGVFPKVDGPGFIFSFSPIEKRTDLPHKPGVPDFLEKAGFMEGIPPTWDGRFSDAMSGVFLGVNDEYGFVRVVSSQ